MITRSGLLCGGAQDLDTPPATEGHAGVELRLINILLISQARMSIPRCQVLLQARNPR